MSENKTILTVDDSPSVRDMLAAVLAGAGFNVVQAVDGREGVTMLKGLDPDVIITDINMPRLDGFQFIEEVRKNPRYSTTPILVLTTETSATMKNRARSAGATGWIVKPFDPEKLIEIICRVGV